MPGLKLLNLPLSTTLMPFHVREPVDLTVLCSDALNVISTGAFGSMIENGSSVKTRNGTSCVIEEKKPGIDVSYVPRIPAPRTSSTMASNDGSVTDPDTPINLLPSEYTLKSLMISGMFAATPITDYLLTLSQSLMDHTQGCRVCLRPVYMVQGTV